MDLTRPSTPLFSGTMLNTPIFRSCRNTQRVALALQTNQRSLSSPKLKSIKNNTISKSKRKLRSSLRKRLLIESSKSPGRPTTVAASWSVSVAVFDWHDIFDRLFREHNLYVEKENAFVLGTGSFGIVIRAWLHDRSVSVKITRDAQRAAEQPFGDFNFLNFQHPNLVRVFDHKRLNSRYSITVMELLEEVATVKNLEQLFLDGFASENRTKIGFAIDISRALVYCHSKRTLHLDIKASNVLVIPHNCHRFVCKLCDFGSSISLDNIRDNLIYKTTLSHTAPELLSGHRADEKCDIYSFAVTMWQIQYECSHVPYQGIANDTIIYNVVKNNWRPTTHTCYAPHTNNESVILPFELCWQTEPKKRPDSEQILRILQHLI